MLNWIWSIGRGEAFRGRGGNAALALGLSVGRDLRCGEAGYPDLLLELPGWSCHSWNQGGRVFGQRYLGDWLTLDVCFPGGQAFGDINGDRRLDQINDEGVFLGHGDGVFGTMTVAFMNQNTPMAFASADLDKDGYDDVLVGTVGVRVYFGQPDGTLRGGEEVLPFQAGDVPPILKLLDIDQDGFEDVLGASNLGPLLAFGRGDGTFELSEQYVGSPQRAKLADFDQDGLLDLVTTARIDRFGSRFIALCVSLGKGRGFVEPRVEIPIEGLDYFRDFPAGVTTGDFNRDGFVDVMTGGGWGKLAVFLGNGDGTFQPQITEFLPVFDPPVGLLFHDLDLDGFGDLVVGYWHAVTEIYWGVEHGFVDYEHRTWIGAKLPFNIEVVIRPIRRSFLRGDADDDGEVRVTDAIYLLRYMFAGGPEPPAPYPEAGGDRTMDEAWGWSNHWGGNLGCSYETFNYYPNYSPCAPDNDQSQCAPRRPILQFIDVAYRE